LFKNETTAYQVTFGSNYTDRVLIELLLDLITPIA